MDSLIYANPQRDQLVPFLPICVWTYVDSEKIPTYQDEI